MPKVQTIIRISVDTEQEGTVRHSRPVHQPQGPAHVTLAAASTRLGGRAGGGDCHLRRCEYQIEQQPSRSGGVFDRGMRPM